jgi:hypothetical protein
MRFIFFVLILQIGRLCRRCNDHKYFVSTFSREPVYFLPLFPKILLLMKFRNYILRISFCILPMVFVLACSNSDGTDLTALCPSGDEAVMTINGEVYTFDISGTSLNSEETGQLLELDFWITNPNSGDVLRFIRLTVYLNETGQNVIDKFTYSQNLDGQSLEGDLVEQSFNSTVTVNNEYCFEASFSGSVTVEGILISITNGKISRVYDDPFNL